MHEDAGIAHAEPLNDLCTDFFRSGSGHRQYIRSIERFNHMGQFKVVRPEIVPPVTDAVRLINGKERDACTAKLIESLRAAKLLRGKKDKFDLALCDTFQGVLMLSCSQGRVDYSGVVELTGLDRLCLVLLEGDEWRNYDGRAIEKTTGNLVNGRFAGACGLDEQGISPFQEALDCFALAGPKRFEPKQFLGCGRDIDWFSISGRLKVTNSWMQTTKKKRHTNTVNSME